MPTDQRLALTKRRLAEVNQVLANNPSAKTRPRWEKLKRALQNEIVVTQRVLASQAR